MTDEIKQPTKIFRNIGITQILRYQLPSPGKVSILHRISGALLFLLLPFSLYLFNQSLTSEISFYALKGLASYLIVKLIVLVLIWAFLFHFFAGLRHLLMDLHLADSLASGTRTATTVLVLSTLLTIIIAIKLFENEAFRIL